MKVIKQSCIILGRSLKQSSFDFPLCQIRRLENLFANSDWVKVQTCRINWWLQACVKRRKWWACGNLAFAQPKCMQKESMEKNHTESISKPFQTYKGDRSNSWNCKQTWTNFTLYLIVIYPSEGFYSSIVTCI